MIGFSYERNAVKINSGVLATYFVKKQKYFFIEVKEHMDNILIIKSTVDGYNIDLCATFSTS